MTPLEEALETLREARGQPRLLVASSGEMHVGVGVFRRLEAEGTDALREIAHAARHLPDGSLLVGGFAFDMASAPEAPWHAFPPALFVVPALAWSWSAEGWQESRNGPMATLPRLKAGTKPSRRPSAVPWVTQVRRAIEAIASGHLAKVVLARREARPPLDDPLQAFARLALSEPEASLFYLEPSPGHAFFGATPERLASLRGGRIETHAVAGTAPRGDGDDAAADVAIGKRLLAAGKESHEHRLAVEHIRKRLESLGLAPEQGARKLRRMARVQHLETQLSASPSAGMHVLDVAAALHPTPAVCGTPTDRAFGLIHDLEATTRGWYAGGVGWFRPDGQGEILVALRCAVATPEGTWLHAGAGITEGSDPAAELMETDAKLQVLEEAVSA